MSKNGKEIWIRVIDIGGDGLRRADVYGTRVENLVKRGPFRANDQNELIYKLLNFVSRGLHTRVKGISYSVAGIIENAQKIITSPNIHLLDGLDLAAITIKKTGEPTVVLNDIDAAARGMAVLLPELSYFMGITWSSGIGIRIFKDGDIITPSEGGHTPLDPSPYASLCGCGVRGCAESVLGGLAVRRRVLAEAEVLKIDVPKSIDPCEFLGQCFDKKEKWALDIYDLISTGMATFLAGIQTTFVLPAIVWKGTFAKCALPRIEKDIRRKMEAKLINPVWARKVKFLFSPKPDEDAFIGAASYNLLKGCL